MGLRFCQLCTKILADGGVACMGKHLRAEAGARNALPTVLTLGAAETCDLPLRG